MGELSVAQMSKKIIGIQEKANNKTWDTLILKTAAIKISL